MVSYLSACTKLFVDKCMHKYANHMEYNKRGPGMTYTQQNSNIALNWLSNRVSEEITNPKRLNISVLYDKLYSFAFAILFIGFATCSSYHSMHLHIRNMTSF